jgi:hypothetical protein
LKIFYNFITDIKGVQQKRCAAFTAAHLDCKRTNSGLKSRKFRPPISQQMLFPLAPEKDKPNNFA